MGVKQKTKTETVDQVRLLGTELRALRKAHGLTLKALADKSDKSLSFLSKIERGFERDLSDVREMIARGLIDREKALELFEAIEPELQRYPAIDPASFRTAVLAALRPE